jgi:hypothetical protein
MEQPLSDFDPTIASSGPFEAFVEVTAAAITLE